MKSRFFQARLHVSHYPQSSQFNQTCITLHISTTLHSTLLANVLYNKSYKCQTQCHGSFCWSFKICRPKVISLGGLPLKSAQKKKKRQIAQKKKILDIYIILPKNIFVESQKKRVSFKRPSHTQVESRSRFGPLVLDPKLFRAGLIKPNYNLVCSNICQSTHVHFESNLMEKSQQLTDDCINYHNPGHLALFIFMWHTEFWNVVHYTDRCGMQTCN